MAKQQTILVTGAAGFIGINIVAQLAAQGHSIIGCDSAQFSERAPSLAHLPFAAWLAPSDLMAWLDEHGTTIESVIHLGAISDTTETDKELLQLNNVRFTLDLWARAARHNWRFLYASSAATYGDGGQGFVDSDDLAYLESLTPLNLYGWSKNQSDQLILQACLAGKPAPTHWAGMKFFNVYGPHEGHKGHMQSLVGKMVPQIQAGEVVRLFQSHHPDYPDGGQLRDFIYVKDACAWMEKALGAPNLGGLYNVGTGAPRSFADLAHATFAALGIPPQIEYVPMPDSIRHQYQYYTRADVAKSQAAGLYSHAYRLELGVADYVKELTKAQA